jgi:hypothetical protein
MTGQTRTAQEWWARADMAAPACAVPRKSSGLKEAGRCLVSHPRRLATVAGVGHRACKPVELGHDEGVAGPDGGQSLVQPSPPPDHGPLLVRLHA